MPGATRSYGTLDYSLTRTRSTAQSFDIRRRSFCLLVAMESSAGKSRPLLVLRADPDEREALLSTGHPFFVPRRAGIIAWGYCSLATQTGTRSGSW